METMKKYRLYWILSILGVTILSFYPLYMGARVIIDMIKDGTVLKENYPKYIIPYTPIAFAVIIGVVLLPLIIKIFKRFATALGSVLSVGVFFLFELLFEHNVVVTTAETVVKLEDWQMYMCYVPPGGWGTTVTEYKTQTPVDILMGNYNPAFKLHFYLISIVIIISVLNCIYGFAQMIKTGDTSRKKALIMQSVSSAVFLGLCILACFTAFWRDGNINVSPLSAILMSVFFILVGVTVGIFIGSFLLKKNRTVAVIIPAAASSVVSLIMYIGEMILLHGHLYRFGTGFLFDGIPFIILAPIDILVIIVSGVVTLLLMRLAKRNTSMNKPL